MPEPIVPPPDSGAGNPPSGGLGTPPTPPEPPKKLEMTQEDFDRIIAERVARAKPKDYDDLVKLRDEQAAAEEAKKTDLQKERDARKAADEKASERVSKADQRLKRAAILAEAVAQKASDSDIVVALLMGSENIEVDEDGEVKGVAEAVKKLLKDKPVLVAGTSSRSGGEFGGADNQTIGEKITELERAGKFKEARALKIQQALK